MQQDVMAVSSVGGFAAFLATSIQVLQLLALVISVVTGAIYLYNVFQTYRKRKASNESKTGK